MWRGGGDVWRGGDDVVSYIEFIVNITSKKTSTEALIDRVKGF